MYGLLYKELFLQRKQIIMVIGVIVLFSLIMFTPISENGIGGMEEVFLIVSLLFIVLIFAVVGMLQQGIFEIDEIKKWQNFICSSPMCNKGQVQVKYIFTLTTSMITLFYCIVINTVACVYQGSKVTIPNDLLIQIMLLQLFLRSIEFPFYFRFGSKNGNNVRILMFFTLIFGIIVYFLFGDLSIFGSKERLVEFLISLVSGDNFSMCITYVMRFLPCVVLIIYYLSYRISCKFYLKGGEYFDK